eukprot:SAG11_NODE_924_length_6525_cov_5.604264_8_plen_63_part_00
MGDCHLPRIALFALGDIVPGTELTYDYAQEINGKVAFKCTCGAPGCRERSSNTAPTAAAKRV